MKFTCKTRVADALPTRECACGYCPEVIALHRAQRIRDIVAQQWAVAIVAMRNTGTIGQATGGTVRDLAWDDGYDVAMEAFAVDLAALPSAAEIVGGGE